MKASDWISLAGVLVSLIGVIITGFLSYWIMRFTKAAALATKESAIASQESAKVAHSTFELAEKMRIEQEKKDKAIRNEYRRIVLNNINKVKTAVFSQNIRIGQGNEVEIDGNAVIKAPREPGITEEQLALYFTKEEIDGIHRVWETYNYWLEKYWGNGVLDDKQAYAAAARVDEPRTAIYEVENIFK